MRAREPTSHDDSLHPLQRAQRPTRERDQVMSTRVVPNRTTRRRDGGSICGIHNFLTCTQGRINSLQSAHTRELSAEDVHNGRGGFPSTASSSPIYLHRTVSSSSHRKWAFDGKKSELDDVPLDAQPSAHWCLPPLPPRLPWPNRHGPTAAARVPRWPPPRRRRWRRGLARARPGDDSP